MDDLRTILETWKTNGNWDKIIRRLEKIDEYKRTNEQNLTLAMAYINRAQEDWKKRKDLERALELLEPMEQAFIDDYLYYVVLGKAYFNLDQWGKANLAFGVAYQYEVPEQIRTSIGTWIQRTEEAMLKPLFKETYESRVKSAWKKFEAIEEECLNILSKTQRRTQEVIDKIEAIFKLALYRPHFQLHRLNGINNLTIPLHNRLMNAFAIEQFKEQAPANFNKNWHIYVGEQTIDFDNLEPNSMYLFFKKQIPDTTIWIEKEEDGVFTISACCSSWDDSPFKSVREPFILMQNLMVTVIGEVIFEKYFKIWKILKEPKKSNDSKAIALADLPSFLKSKGIDISASAKEILNQSTNYTRLPSNTPDAFPFRQDIISGSSLCMKFLLDYDNRDEEEVEELEAHGASLGFLFYRLDNFTGKNREKDIQDFRVALKNQLIAKAGATAVKIIGEAHGSKFDYLDVIAWDLPKTLDTAMEFFSKSSVPFSGYQVFRKFSGTVILTGSTFWMEKKPLVPGSLKKPFFSSGKRSGNEVVH